MLKLANFTVTILYDLVIFYRVACNVIEKMIFSFFSGIKSLKVISSSCNCWHAYTNFYHIFVVFPYNVLLLLFLYPTYIKTNSSSTFIDKCAREFLINFN